MDIGQWVILSCGKESLEETFSSRFRWKTSGSTLLPRGKLAQSNIVTNTWYPLIEAAHTVTKEDQQKNGGSRVNGKPRLAEASEQE